jgi:hypothetical protein
MNANILYLASFKIAREKHRGFKDYYHRVLNKTANSYDGNSAPRSEHDGSSLQTHERCCSRAILNEAKYKIFAFIFWRVVDTRRCQ